MKQSQHQDPYPRLPGRMWRSDHLPQSLLIRQQAGLMRRRQHGSRGIAGLNLRVLLTGWLYSLDKYRSGMFFAPDQGRPPHDLD